MAKLSVGNGIGDYVKVLEEIGANTEEVLGTAIYEMADIVADEIKANIKGLDTISEHMAMNAWKKNEPAKLTKAQKKGLVDSMGIAPLKKENGYWHVKVGFDGYNDIKTKTYPNGQPNVLIARITESGGSYRVKQPFVRPAVSKTKAKAEETAQKVIDEKIKEIVKEK